MSAQDDRAHADKYAEGDLLAVLYRQHADITEALDRVSDSKGEDRSTNFAAAKSFMTRHESAEQQIVRPIVEAADNAAEAAERNAEELKADQAIAGLSALDVDSDEFDTQFATFKQAVTNHAEAEETNEFPIIEKAQSQERRIVLGRQFLQAQAAS
jgi:hypothetical protein